MSDQNYEDGQFHQGLDLGVGREVGPSLMERMGSRLLLGSAHLLGGVYRGSKGVMFNGLKQLDGWAAWVMLVIGVGGLYRWMQYGRSWDVLPKGIPYGFGAVALLLLVSSWIYRLHRKHYETDLLDEDDELGGTEHTGPGVSATVWSLFLVAVTVAAFVAIFVYRPDRVPGAAMMLVVLMLFPDRVGAAVADKKQHDYERAVEQKYKQRYDSYVETVQPSLAFINSFSQWSNNTLMPFLTEHGNKIGELVSEANHAAVNANRAMRSAEELETNAEHAVKEAVRRGEPGRVRDADDRAELDREEFDRLQEERPVLYAAAQYGAAAKLRDDAQQNGADPHGQAYSQT